MTAAQIVALVLGVVVIVGLLWAARINRKVEARLAARQQDTLKQIGFLLGLKAARGHILQVLDEDDQEWVLIFQSEAGRDQAYDFVADPPDREPVDY